MNPANIQIELRKRRLDEIFDLALILLRRRPTIWKLLIFLYAAGTLSHLLWNSIWKGNEYSSVFSLLFFIIISPLYVMGLTVTLGLAMFEATPTFKSFLQWIGSGLTIFTVRFALYRIFYTITLPFLFPIYFLWYRDFFLAEVLLLEGQRGPALKERLRILSHHAQERITAFQFYHLLIFSLSLGALLMSSGLLQDLLFGRSLLSNLAPFSGPDFLAIVHGYMFFYTTTHFLFYIDTRSLIEGWDVQMMLAAASQSRTIT
ncbi:MAG: hypothetical protein HS115_02615 [Spirochaetales bacterium]|nr:hypothetical protein [Spirochaetales bacterium]